MFKRVLRKLVPNAVRRLRRPLPPAFSLTSFSQEGEDMVLRRYFEDRTTPGRFVDVGAHHPQRFSNTYYFYLQGWRGINIDAMPGSMTPFRAVRPDDVNVEAAISHEPQTLTYCVFNDGALNTFDPVLAAEREALPGYHVVERVPIRTRTLAEVLAEAIPTGSVIDFMSVDVEGLDLQVLRSNDWSRFRPELVLAEDSNARGGLPQIAETPICRFMNEQGYIPWASTGMTVVYQRTP